MRAFRRVLILLVFVAFLVMGWRFAHQNESAVSVHYLFGQTAEVSLWKVIGLSTSVGAVCVGVGMGWALLRARFEARGYRKKMLAFESEVHQLRHLPAAGVKKTRKRSSEVTEKN
ncbi:LapA family protein [Myxococcota bacterium]|nr:LapA family protein [Myxococcota bacterium]